jgi:hypothetical protein
MTAGTLTLVSRPERPAHGGEVIAAAERRVLYSFEEKVFTI